MLKNIIPNEVEITQLYNSETAFDNIISNNFDLILLDLKMPVVSGFDILKKLKNINYFNNNPSIKIVIITALLHHDIDDLINNYKSINIIYKPLKINKLKEIIF